MFGILDTYMRRIFVLTSFFIVLFSVRAPLADAALLYFDPAGSTVSRGDTISLGLRIDTDEDECINTVDVVVHYDSSVRAVDVSRGNSILNVWVEDPLIDEQNHTIKFAAGIPGGYCGRIAGDPSLTNVLAEFVFQSPGLAIGGGSNSNQARIWIDESSQVLLHDGYGTNASIRLEDALITLASTPGNTLSDDWKNVISGDKELPADFAITLSKEDTAFSGKYFITFSSLDKQSGIDHYEVMEEPFSEFNAFRWGRADAPWVTTQSPYVLKDQTLNSTLRVKAIDKAGNERIAVLVPDVALRSISHASLVSWVVFGTVGILVLALTGYILWRRRQNLLSEEPEEHV